MTQIPETILLIEDEEDVSDLIGYHLKKSKFLVLSASDGAKGLQMAIDERPDAVVLDIMMPRLNGFEVAKRLKADLRTEPIPILFLSAKGEVESRIKGLEMGADDYISKPFSPRELVLRIQSLLRRISSTTMPYTYEAGPLVLERATLKVTVHGERLDLTSTEFKLLYLLVGSDGISQSREHLLKHVWGYNNAIDTRTVDTHIRRLREKLGIHADFLQTVRGEGYRFISSIPQTL
jgi:two-component system phosphate regulon response regulator PhoB